MTIVTLMDYRDGVHVLMCKMWLYLARRFHPEARIVVLHHDKFDAIDRFARRMGAEPVKTDLTAIPPAGVWSANNPEADCPWTDLTISVWRMYERLKLGRFIFLEPDAFPLGNLDKLWQLGAEKPFIGIAERAEWAGIAPYMNMGVYVYDGSDFLTYDKLYDYWRRCDYTIPYPLGDQGLINGYFKDISYSPFHPEIGIEWNCLAANCKVIRAYDAEIEVRSPKRPAFAQPGWEFEQNYIGWDKDVRVKILHSFGPTWKHWMLKDEARLWDYLCTKVAELER